MAERGSDGIENGAVMPLPAWVGCAAAVGLQLAAIAVLSVASLRFHPAVWVIGISVASACAVVALGLLTYRAGSRLIADLSEHRRAEAALRRQVALLERALVPGKPYIGEGYEVAATYIPAAGDREIGGDFYDVFITEYGKSAVCIGDVSGKGIEAAALAAATRGTVRAFTYEMPAVEEALSHSNAVLFSHDAHSGSFVTVLLLVLDPADGRFTYSSAGHPPAAVFRANGRIEFIHAGSPPIGVDRSTRFVAGRGRLKPGDRLILYTDGIVEARRDGNLFELSRLRCTLLDHRNVPVRQLADAIVKAASDWAGGRFQDDVAVIAIERLPST